jgi:hypothetical protein
MRGVAVVGRCASRVRCRSPRWPRVATAALIGVASVCGGAETMTPGIPPCIPVRGNSIVSLSVSPETGWSSVRTYFRKAGSPDFYYVEMRSAGQGRYWAALPRPEESTATVEVQMAVRDVEGKETRAPLDKIPVTTSCGQTLTSEQNGYAQNLVVGETLPSQEGEVVSGFLCDGVISRIDSGGNLRPDEACRKALMAAAAQNRKIIIPLIILGAGGIVYVTHREPPEASQAHP